jgi:integrase/recombinase XerD
VGTTARNHDGRFARDGAAITAEAALGTKQAELAERHAVPKGGTVKLHRIFENRLADLDLDNRDHKTIDRNRKSFERFAAWLDAEGTDPAGVSETDLRIYFNKALPKLVAATTAETEAQHVKTAYRYAAEDGLLKTNPVTRRVKVPKASTREPEPYTHDDLRRIRSVLMSDFEETVFYAFVYGGLRRHELVELTRDDLDFRNSIVHVRGKGGKHRRVPLHPHLSKVLSRYVLHHPSKDGLVLARGGSMRNVNDRFAKLLARAEVPATNRPVHRIRKTASTSLRREGVHPDVIDRIFGWSPTSVRQRFYSGVDDEELHEAILRLYRSDPIERLPGTRAVPPASRQLMARAV